MLNFSDNAKEIYTIANQVAIKHKDEKIRVEYLLYGLLVDRDCVKILDLVTYISNIAILPAKADKTRDIEGLKSLIQPLNGIEVRPTDILYAIAKMENSILNKFKGFSSELILKYIQEYPNPIQAKIICLCGSTKFKDEFLKVTKDETLKSNIVLSVGVFGHADKVELSIGQKRMLDELHRRKIDLCNEVIVINKDGYIGESTKLEIEYALSRGKIVRYMENDA